MRCCCHRELIHELLQPDWVGYVEIESPERLKEEYLDYLERAKKAVVLGQNWDKKIMKIITWNINSVRLRLPLVLRLLKEQAPDVLCL